MVAVSKVLRFVCGRSYRNEIERQDGEEMVKFCFLYTADYVEVRTSDRMVKK